MPSRQLTVTSFLLVLLLILAASSAFAATQIGSLSSAQFVYYDITLPTPQIYMIDSLFFFIMLCIHNFYFFLCQRENETVFGRNLEGYLG